MELSKIVQKGGKDNSKPHAKLTAIENLLKEEIESSIGNSLSKNNDLQIVNINESVGSKNPAIFIEEDDNGYWSDFSDDEYTQEIKEEKKAKDVVSSLQRWVYNSNIEKELSNSYKSNIISLDQFKESLYDAGYHCEFIDLQALLKRLDTSGDAGIDYKQFFNDLSDKNAAWWNKKIVSNGLEVSGHGKRNGNYRELCNKPIYNFISSNIGTLTKQAINRAGYLSISEFIDEIYQDSPNGLTKRSLRNELREKEIPITRLDTHILFKNLEDANNKISKRDLKSYVDDPNEFVVAKGINAVGSAQKIWIEEEVMDEAGGVKLNAGQSQYDGPLNNLRNHIKNNGIDVLTTLGS